MRHVTFIFRCWLLLAFLLAENLAVAETKNSLLIVGEEFPPFEFTRGQEIVGIDVDIARYIFNKLEIPVKFELYPYKRAWRMVELGQADAILSTSRKPKRMQYVWFPKHDMWISEYVFFLRADGSIKDFHGYSTIIERDLKIGVTRGNSYDDSFWKHFPYEDGSTVYQGVFRKVKVNRQIYVNSNVNENLMLLAKGRIDVFPLDRIVGTYTANINGFGRDLLYYDKPVFSKPYPMPFSKQSTYPNIEFISNEFDKALGEMKSNGVYQSIVEKWLQ